MLGEVSSVEPEDQDPGGRAAMSRKTGVGESLIEQILAEMFVSLKGREEFDPETIEKLKRLATDGGLKKPKKVAESIKSVPGGHHEVA